MRYITWKLQSWPNRLKLKIQSFQTLLILKISSLSILDQNCRSLCSHKVSIPRHAKIQIQLMSYLLINSLKYVRIIKRPKLFNLLIKTRKGRSRSIPCRFNRCKAPSQPLKSPHPWGKDLKVARGLNLRANKGQDHLLEQRETQLKQLFSSLWILQNSRLRFIHVA